MPDYISTNLYGTAIGTTSTLPFITHFDTRNPNLHDINYPIQTRWVNTTGPIEWILVSFASSLGVVTAVWEELGAVNGGVEFLTGNTGGAVTFDNSHNINVVGDGSTIVIAGNPATNTLTASLINSSSYVANTGSAAPVAGVLNVLGSAGIATTGAGNTITITPTTLATTFDTDSGTAVPSGGVLNIFGTSGAIATSGAGNTVTINAGDDVATSYTADTGTAIPVANILTVSGAGGIATSGSGGTLTIDGTTAGIVRQYVFYTDGSAVLTTTTTFNQINVPPSNTDGVALMSGAITPSNAANRLLVKFQTASHTNKSAANSQASWILRDGGTSAVAARLVAVDIGDIAQHSIVYQTTAGSTAATTFHVRVGVQAGGGSTMTINGVGGAPELGGTLFSTLEIWEITP